MVDAAAAGSTVRQNEEKPAMTNMDTSSVPATPTPRVGPLPRAEPDSPMQPATKKTRLAHAKRPKDLQTKLENTKNKLKSVEKLAAVHAIEQREHFPEPSVSSGTTSKSSSQSNNLIAHSPEVTPAPSTSLSRSVPWYDDDNMETGGVTDACEEQGHPLPPDKDTATDEDDNFY